MTEREWDLLEWAQDLAADGGLDLTNPRAMGAAIQRRLETDVCDLRRFGYACDVRRDAIGRIVGVRLLLH
jgi:hypothetical protein